MVLKRWSSCRHAWKDPLKKRMCYMQVWKKPNEKNQLIQACIILGSCVLGSIIFINHFPFSGINSIHKLIPLLNTSLMLPDIIRAAYVVAGLVSQKEQNQELKVAFFWPFIMHRVENRQAFARCFVCLTKHIISFSLDSLVCITWYLHFTWYG